MRGVIPDIPKPMAEVRNRPFLEHLMDYWIEQGIAKFILSVGYRYEVILDHFDSVYRGIPVEYSIEHEPLGTGGGILLAARSLIEPFLLINGDTFFAVELSRLLNFHTSRKSDFTFSLFQTQETERYMAIEIGQEGNILALKSKSKQETCLANGGVYVVEPSALLKVPYEADASVSLENELLPIMSDLGVRFFGQEYASLFIDIGIPTDYSRAGNVLP